MRYSDIVIELSKITRQLSELAEKLTKIDEATPAVDLSKHAKLSDKLLLTVSDTAEMLSLSKVTVYQLTHREDFPAIHIGSRTLIPRDKLIEWVNNHCTYDN